MEQEKTDKTVVWNSDSVYAFGLHKIISTILGTWPLECQDVFSKIRFCTVVFLQISMLFSLIAESFTECFTVNDVGALMTMVAASILSLTKLVSLRFYFCSKIFTIVVSAMEDWSNAKSPRALGIMKNHAKLVRSVCMWQMTTGYLSAMLLVIGALPFFALPSVNATMTNDSETFEFRGLPLSTVCLYGEMSNVSYATVFTIQTLQLLLLVTGNIGNDVFFFAITIHLCGQFQLLGEDLQNFGVNVHEEKLHYELVKLVERHVKLSQLAQQIEASFNIIILMQLSVNASQMCMMGIQMIMSLKSGDIVMVINGIIVVCLLTLQIFFYSYAGDRLSSQIENLGVSAYFSPWYNLPPRLAKDVPFIIMRNHKGFNVTGGKVFRIDIDNFKNLMKALGSYFSVLRVMFDT